MVDAWVVSWRVQIGFKTSETVGAAWQSVRDLGCVPGAGVDLLQGPGGGGGQCGFGLLDAVGARKPEIGFFGKRSFRFDGNPPSE